MVYETLNSDYLFLTAYINTVYNSIHSMKILFILIHAKKREQQ